MPDSCLGPVCEYIHLLSQWLKIHLLPFGPLFTPLVASVAGAIALYSIHVTRSVARKRAAVDFFLKTDMDKTMVDAHTAFQKALKPMEAHACSGKSMESFCKDAEGFYTADYLAITSYLNIHELVAMGIKNKVFDEEVCYNFWSDALVQHANDAHRLIEYESSIKGSEAAFLELRSLKVKWERRNLKWQERQQRKAKRQGQPPATVQSAQAAGQSPVPPSQETTVANPLPSTKPAGPPPATPG